MPNSTTTLQQVVDYAKTFPEISPVFAAAGWSNQPALTIANRVMTRMLSPGMPWKWNRVIPPPFYTLALQQDYASETVGLRWLQAAWLLDFNSTAIPKPIWPIEAVREMAPTSWQFIRPSMASVLPNNQLQYGTWAALAQWPQVVGIPSQPYNGPLSQIQDPNGNFWRISNLGSSAIMTGSVQPTWPTSPVYPTAASPSTVATTVADGSVIWQAVNPDGQGFRIGPLPGSGQVYYQAFLVGQLDRPTFTSLGQTLEPVPDSYDSYFKDGFVAYCYRHVSDPKIRMKSEAEERNWMASVMEVLAADSREKEEYGFFPTEALQVGNYPLWIGPANPYYPGY